MTLFEVNTWNLNEESELVLLSRSIDMVGNVTFAPDGRSLTSRYDVERHLLSVETGKAHVVSHTWNIAGFLPDGTLLAIATKDETKLFNTRTAAMLRSFKGKPATFQIPKFLPSGMYFVFMTEHAVYLWETVTGAMCATLEEAIKFAEFSPDDEYFAVLR
jgi:WD40 repeat protein